MAFHMGRGFLLFQARPTLGLHCTLGTTHGVKKMAVHTHFSTIEWFANASWIHYDRIKFSEVYTPIAVDT